MEKEGSEVCLGKSSEINSARWLGGRAGGSEKNCCGSSQRDKFSWSESSRLAREARASSERRKHFSMATVEFAPQARRRSEANKRVRL